MEPTKDIIKAKHTAYAKEANAICKKYGMTEHDKSRLYLCIKAAGHMKFKLSEE